LDNKNKKPSGLKILAWYFAVFIVIALIISLVWGGQVSGEQTVNLSFSEFTSKLEAQQVKKLSISEGSRAYSGYLKDGTRFIAYAPTDYDMAVISQYYIVPQSADGILEVASSKPNNWLSWVSLIPTAVMVIILIIMLRNMAGGGGNKSVMNFGKSRAKMVKDKKVTFADVAGLEEEKKELSEIVDFLKNPKKYTELGARIPRGVLLVGPPGTGKTFISKAVAGEAGVPFFSISGSDFVEMFVGVGASRVRDLFEDAKKNAPCIVFIDEIDAVGRRRGAGIGGGNDEREQTLNQLLVEMDGFDVNEGIIILAATNRPDVLDPAILRPGRFDRQVVISVPDVKGREEVFKVYTKNKPLDENINLKTLAKRTPGFTPADIENMMNEAALLTARRDGSIIHMEDLEEAITRVIAGPKKTSHVMTEKEKKLTAFHEAGHAIIHRSIEGMDPVHQVTIMPRGNAGGFTMTLPEEDRSYATKKEMLDEIVSFMGGRVAEAIVLGDISTGASNDLERATKIAHDMVAKYGMTDAIGPVNYSDAEEVFLGRDFTSKQNYSEELASKIDAEVRRILDECYERCEKILTEHRDDLDRIANALLELETLDEEDFEAIFTQAKTAQEIAEDKEVKSKEQKEREDKEAEERRKREAAERKTSSSNVKDPIQEALREGKRVAVIGKNGSVVDILNEMKKELDDPDIYEERKAQDEEMFEKNKIKKLEPKSEQQSEEQETPENVTPDEIKEEVSEETPVENVEEVSTEAPAENTEAETEQKEE